MEIWKTIMTSIFSQIKNPYFQAITMIFGLLMLFGKKLGTLNLWVIVAISVGVVLLIFILSRIGNRYEEKQEDKDESKKSQQQSKEKAESLYANAELIKETYDCGNGYQYQCAKRKGVWVATIKGPVLQADGSTKIKQIAKKELS